MNELAIKILENALYEPMATLAFARTSTPQDRIKCDELGAKIKDIKSAIELLKNHPMWTDEDMFRAMESGAILGEMQESIDMGKWLIEYRKQKESKNG